MHKEKHYLQSHFSHSQIRTYVNPSIGNGRPSIGNGHPSIGNGHPSIRNGHPSIRNGHPSIGNGRPSTRNGHPSIGDGHLSTRNVNPRFVFRFFSLLNNFSTYFSSLTFLTPAFRLSESIFVRAVACERPMVACERPMVACERPMDACERRLKACGCIYLNVWSENKTKETK